MRSLARCAILVPMVLLAGLAAGADRKPVLAILDFESPEPDLGRKVARRLERRAMEANTHVLVDRDDIRLALKEAGLSVKLAGNEKALQAFARESLGADLVLWGKATPLEKGFHVEIRCMETHGEPKPYLAVGRDCVNFAALANFYTDFEPILLKKRTTLRKLHPVAPQARKVNLVKNGSFEEGTWTPAHWSPVDGLTSFWVERDDGKGKCLMCDTEVLISQAEAWWKKIRSGQATAKDAPKKIPVKPNQIYSTVGGLDGVQIYSDFIPVKPKMRYRLSVEIKARWGGIFFPKAFVKGYADQTDEFTTQKRELYRAYLALRTKTQGRKWETFSRTFNPTLRTPKVRFIRVMLYSYWPLGKYYWDNVVITEEGIED